MSENQYFMLNPVGSPKRAPIPKPPCSVIGLAVKALADGAAAFGWTAFVLAAAASSALAACPAARAAATTVAENTCEAFFISFLSLGVNHSAPPFGSQDLERGPCHFKRGHPNFLVSK